MKLRVLVSGPDFRIFGVEAEVLGEDNSIKVPSGLGGFIAFIGILAYGTGFPCVIQLGGNSVSIPPHGSTKFICLKPRPARLEFSALVKKEAAYFCLAHIRTVTLHSPIYLNKDVIPIS